MHVLVIAQYFPPDMGGGSARASNVVKGLINKGCNVTVIAAFPHYPHGKVPVKYKGKPIVAEQAGGAKVLRVWIPSLPHSSLANRVVLHACFIVSSLFALPFIEGFDVVWAANPNLFCFYSAIVYGFVKQKPIVRNVDDLWPEVFYELGLVRVRLMRMMLHFLAWFSYVVPAAITPLSPGYKRRIVEKYGVCAEKIHVVEVGVDGIKPFNADRNSNEQFIVMYSGVLGLGYDFDIVLKAASLLAENKDVLFVIRGVGELAPRLRRQVRSFNLKNVVFDTSLLPKDELVALLRSADVFLLPMASASSVDEGLPTKVFEYQAYGKPTICVSSGEPARYVEATGSGLVVKPKDVYAFADAVVRLYKDKKLAAELGRNGWRHVSENLTAEKIGERMYKVLVLVRHE
ncbi:MAG: glycosyltransferase family 4 protein [Candidatus Bathyarchaeota archaeon]|nr:glycosyltransferase family 4 protein [Candidatus Bathyarchaeota archaeon]